MLMYGPPFIKLIALLNADAVEWTPAKNVALGRVNVAPIAMVLLPKAETESFPTAQ